MGSEQISAKEKLALEAIKMAYGTEKDEFGGTLFVSHHLNEVDPEYWEKHLGTAKPVPKDVLDLIQLKEVWDDESVFDFSLPEDVSYYVISVRFDEYGVVEGITMES